MDSNNADFVDFSGHGSYASWATHAPSDDRTWLPPKSIISPYTGWLYIDYEMYNGYCGKCREILDWKNTLNDIKELEK